VEASALFDPIAYYSPETLMFPAIAQSFADTGILDPAALYLILDWKAPRARTRHLSRLARMAGSFNAAVNEIAADLHAATAPEQQLGLLMTKWGFRLPTASAVLSVLYPATFTIYDIRVCRVLGNFDKLEHKKWSAETWRAYQQFIAAVRDSAPSGLSLRDCDRWLWGKDKQRTLVAELASARARAAGA
jgi:hypothetical protein